MAELVPIDDVKPLAVPPESWKLVSRPDWDVNPLKMLPREWLPAVAALWTANAHLFPSALPICATLRLYGEDHGLTGPELSGVVRALLHPERRAGHRFASDVIAELSALVAAVLRRRDSAERQHERRELFERWAAESVTPEQFRAAQIAHDLASMMAVHVG